MKIAWGVVLITYLDILGISLYYKTIGRWATSSFFPAIYFVTASLFRKEFKITKTSCDYVIHISAYERLSFSF